MLQEINENRYIVRQMDGAAGMLLLPNNSIKLIYGSPPYPNAERDYGVWHSSEYIDKMSPFLNAACMKLRKDGFIVINVKANREKATSKVASRRSLVIEKLAIEMEERWHLHCVDIEIWIKENPVPTGLRAACQDAYEQNLWFSKAPKWTINLDAIRRPNPLGALPKNVISGGVSSRKGDHPATQPLYLPEKYIKATTNINDLVVDPWMGSGTTGFAALSLGRQFAGFDVMKEYVTQADIRLRSIAGGMNDGERQKT